MQRGLLLLHHKRENSLHSPFKQQDHNIHVAQAGGNMKRGLLLLHHKRENSLNSPFKQQDHHIHVAQAEGDMRCSCVTRETS